MYEPVTESSEHNYSNNDRSFEINEHNYANNEHSFEIDEPNYNEMGFKITEHNYSNDENKFEINEHNYANVSHEESNEHQESESYPDLLQMVTRDKPSAVSDKPRQRWTQEFFNLWESISVMNTIIMKLYFKICMRRK